MLKDTIKLEFFLLQVECKHGPERKISGSRFSNIAPILTVNILKNRNIESILFKYRNKCKTYFFPVEILSGGKNLILNLMLQ